MADDGLTEAQLDLLDYLTPYTGYATVWSIIDARAYREMETLGLVKIGKAPDAPKDGSKAQPYFGVKLKAAGRSALKAVKLP